MKLFILFFSFFLLSAKGQASELRPFETDYCTNFPEGTPQEPELWKHCCLMHDMFFWAGGTRQERDEVDLKLRQCIEKTGAEKIAKLMYWSVRATSHSPIKYPKKKWGNGWPGRDDSLALTLEEIRRLEGELIPGYDFISLEMKHSFLEELQAR